MEWNGMEQTSFYPFYNNNNNNNRSLNSKHTRLYFSTLSPEEITLLFYLNLKVKLA
jgi:hypothetical protein